VSIDKFFIPLYLVLLIPFMLITACAGDSVDTKKEKPFVVEESFKEASRLIEKGFYEDARTLLETIKTRDTSQKYPLLARLRIADTYYYDEAYEEAVTEYQAFLDLYPYHKYSSYAQYKLAMSYFSRIHSVDISYSWAKQALSEFKKLQRNYPRNPYMDVIESRIRSCRNILADYEFYVGNFYFKKGAYQAALGRFRGLVKSYPGSSRVPEALYYSGLSHEELGQASEAIKSLSTLLDKFPAAEFSADAQKHLASLHKQK